MSSVRQTRWVRCLITQGREKKKGNSFNLFSFLGDEFFDLLNLDGISAMKIDVEGFELEVLQGLKKTLLMYKPFVFVKYGIYLQRLTLAIKEKFRRSGSICEFLREIDYEIIGFGVRREQFSRD